MAYNELDEKQNSGSVFDANRAKSRKNKLNAISSFVSQNQTSNNPNAVALKASQQNKTVGAVNTAQTDQNALTVQTGQNIQADTVKNTSGAGLQVTGTTLDTTKPVNFQSSTSDERRVGALDNKLDTVSQLAKTGKASVTAVDIDNALTQEIDVMKKKREGILAAYNGFNKALDDNALADIARLDAQLKIAQDKLASNSTTNLAEVGATNALEGQALGVSDALTSGKAGNVGYLESVFGPGYDAGRFGGLDSQIYNKDVNQARENAKANTEAMQVAKGGKANAIQGYLQNIKQSKEAIDKFSTSFRDQVAEAKTSGRKIYDTAVDAVDKQYANDTKTATNYANSVKAKGAGRAADVDSARKILGNDNFDRWVKNLDNGDNPTDFNYTVREGEVSDSRDVGKNRVGKEGLIETRNKLRKAMETNPGNQTISSLFSRADKAYNDLVVQEGKDFTTRKQEEEVARKRREADARKKREEDARNKSEARDSVKGADFSSKEKP